MEYWNNTSLRSFAGEIWKPFPGFEQTHGISNFGRVKSYSRKVHSPLTNGRTLLEIIRRLKLNTGGYPTITLSLGRSGAIKKQTSRIHRIVAKVFLPNPENKRCVNHKNGIKTDNRVENLEWVTHSENSLHSYRVLHRAPNRNRLGKYGRLNNLAAVLVAFDPLTYEVEIYFGLKDASEKTGISAASINLCYNKKMKTAGGKVWRMIR